MIPGRKNSGGIYMDEIKVFSPATVANVACGFDCLGFALEKPFDEMTLRRIPEKEVRIVHHDGFGLPTEAGRNVAGVVLLSMLDAVDADFGFEAGITKHIKPGSGIGSSSASAAGAAFAANELLDRRFSKTELVSFAMGGEELASGSRHADNVAPCIYGGFTLVRSKDPLDIAEVAFPELFATVIHPEIEVRTSDAREILKQNISLPVAVEQWSNIAGLVAGLSNGDYGLISRSLEDRIIEPVRKVLIPKFDELKNAGLEAGALGGGISGSGPSVFMFSENSETANRVESVMRGVFTDSGLEFNTYVSKINSRGVKTAD
ncbi:MAG: homoserine kinase [Pyrinomonadaceae bacterium]